MGWFKVDGSLHSHPKVLAAGNAAIGLWTKCGSYCAEYLTDGFVPAEIARKNGRKSEANALVSCGLWVPVEGGYMMHEYHERNPSRDQVLAQRKATAKRVDRFRNRQNSNGVTDDDVTPLVTAPHPIPSHPSTSSSRDTSTTSTGVGAAAVELYVEADMAARSVTSIRNARSYRRQVADNALRQHGQAIADYLERYPAATPVDVAVEVLGIDGYDARCAWTVLHPEDETG